MGRTPGERKDINFSVKLSPGELEWLEGMKESLELNSTAEVIRGFIRAVRTLFGLPPYMVEHLREDMKKRGLSSEQYIQELLAKRYEELPKHGAGEKPHATRK